MVPATARALDLDLAMVLLDDLVHDRQAEAGAFVFSALVLGCEERIKNVLEIRFGMPCPVSSVSIWTQAFRPAWTSCLVRTRSLRPFRSSHPWH